MPPIETGQSMDWQDLSFPKAKAMKSISVDEAISTIESRAPNPVSTSQPLVRCAGRVLARDVRAIRDQPPFISSAMDGYAVIKPEDWRTETSVFTLIGESQAGARYSGALSAGEAVRIFTGAPVPAGATAVVLQENVTRQGDQIVVNGDGQKDKSHIRPAAQDYASGDRLLCAGERLDAWRLSLAASAGHGCLDVAAKPRIAIVCSGNELVPPGTPVNDDEIFESNSIALVTLVEAWGAEPIFAGIGRDDLGALTSRLAAIDADLIVTVGGASVGDYDLVKPALRSLGYIADFERIDLRPGRPTSFGILPDGTPVLGLPGNPASALVCAQLFLKAFIDKALGKPPITEMRLPLAVGLAATGPREAFLRAKRVIDSLGRANLQAFADQDSALIQIFAGAAALIRRPANSPAAAAGEWVRFIPLDRM
jgi:molybdopterin molybdotransferase